MFTLLIAIAGCILTGIAACIQYSEKKKSDSDAEESKSKLNLANVQLKALQNQINERSNQLEKANQKIIEIQENSLKQITGGDNLPLIVASFSGKGETPYDLKTMTHGDRMIFQNSITFYLANGGKYSIKDIIFSIKDDYNVPATVQQITPYNYHNNSFNSDDLGKYQNIEVGTLSLKSKKLFTLRICLRMTVLEITNLILL